MYKGIINRFEEENAFVEMEWLTKKFSKSMFPAYAAVGDVVKIEGENAVVLAEETEKLRLETDEAWEE
ncbi:DUF3006 domain-containing protein [Mesobacillus foraminis]|uniref:DUF3006 domain-containing protein n=1 Tax=Mesobacillus foraminis TaxID=279826 RepID=UPI001BE5560D|nr:DUF3006 domain-containing protein [Mesobacillus foraminis]MBT2757257.1 DUF3006 domain-containing protein [Mesobacillus foraminis]